MLWDKELGRREFLKWTGLQGVAMAALLNLRCVPFKKVGDTNPYVPKNLREVSDHTLNMYRSEFAYTVGKSKGFSMHCSNCKGNCAWSLFENNGKVIREEQVAKYPQINLEIPDANPRGCNKGAIHSQSLYEKDRVLYPMKKIDGKWKRITWDEAIEEIAQKTVGLISRKKFDNVMVYAGTGILSPVRRAASLRFGSLLGAVRFNVASAIGDMFPGVTIPYGFSTIGCTSEAWYEADYLLTWAMNPDVSRIPDAHYIWEGKYRGARVVSISPDFNQTSKHSSVWLPVKPGTDSFFAMSMINVIIKEKLYKEDFIREQTDLPFLVKTNDGKLLRQSDISPVGSDEVFYFYDEASSEIVEAPGSKGSKESTLRLNGVKPAIEGVFKASDVSGKEINVTTVFEMIKKAAAKFPPEEAQKFTGIHPSIIYEEARRFARAKVAIILMGYRAHKYLWGTLTAWGAALMLALTGHTGRQGGLDVDNEWKLGGFETISSPKPVRFGSGFLGEWFDGEMWQSFLTHYDDNELKQKVGLNKQEIIDLAKNAVDKEGFPYFGKPKLIILFHDNKFVRSKAQKATEKVIRSSAELIVSVTHRWDSSALMADIVLPSKSNYESWELRADPGYSRFANVMVPPEGLSLPGEVKSEWEICMLLSKKIQEISKEKGITKIKDSAFDTTRDLGTLYNDFITVEKDTKITSDKNLFEWVVSKSTDSTEGADVETLKKKGFVKLGKAAGQSSPLYSDKPFYPLEPQVYLKRPYSTLSGRQQFYVDHPIYLKLGCATPTARQPVRPDKYPFVYYTPHTRYGIHTNWRSSKYLLRLQRGTPYICINPSVAKAKGIQDGDMVQVFNDVGEMFAMAKLHPGTPDNVIWTEHAWENFQFKDNKGYNNVVAGILSPLELAGNYGHLSFNPFWDGNQIAAESSVDIKKIKGKA